MTIKESKISREYSKAIESQSNSVVSKTGNAKFAGYSHQELSQLPEDITQHSFGCGNPMAFSKVEPGQSVLDLGCGAGLDLLLASEKVGEAGKVIGVDFNQDMLALAKKRIHGIHNIELRYGRIENLPVESNSIDWVISNCVINLSNDKQSAFNEIARVLNQNGQMLVSDIVAEKLPWWVRRSGILKAACIGGVISEQQYLNGLSKAGLVSAAIIDRQFYEPSQLASIVSDAAPALIRNIKCCGKRILHTILTKLATPLSKKLWSAKIRASVS